MATGKRKPKKTGEQLSAVPAARPYYWLLNPLTLEDIIQHAEGALEADPMRIGKAKWSQGLTHARMAIESVKRGSTEAAVWAALHAFQAVMVAELAEGPAKLVAPTRRIRAAAKQNAESARRQSKEAAAKRASRIRARFKTLTASGENDRAEAISIMENDGHSRATIYRALGLGRKKPVKSDRPVE